MDKLKRNQGYPIADYEQRRIPRPNRREVRAIWTGEVRVPNAGEWFLSGAIIEAHYTENDLSDGHRPIARLARPMQVIERWEEI